MVIIRTNADKIVIANRNACTKANDTADLGVGAKGAVGERVSYSVQRRS